jgi:hypothetical protein
MELRRLVSLAALVVLAAARPASAEQALPEFGPLEYVRHHGRPRIATAHFAVCGPERAFRLRVENGPGRRPRVHGGTIRLNGIEVVGERDFHHRAAVIERRVVLRAENRLAVRLAGRPDSSVRVTILARTPCAEMAFTAPAPGAVVPAGRLPVEGTVRGAAEAGVLVNGIRAAVQGERFAALVPVDVGVTELVARATLPDGTIREARLPLTVTAAPESALLFQATPAGGPAPLSVRFTVAALADGAEVRLDLGDGRVFTHPDLDTLTFTYDRPGLYFPTVTLTDPAGTIDRVSVLVDVVDRVAFDARLRARWTALKDALRAGDLARALDAVAIPARDHYRELLSALTVPLSAIDQVLTDIELVDADEFQAEYQMLRDDNGERLSYYVRFVKDQDGLWRLEFF